MKNKVYECEYFNILAYSAYEINVFNGINFKKNVFFFMISFIMIMINIIIIIYTIMYFQAFRRVVVLLFAYVLSYLCCNYHCQLSNNRLNS